MKETCVSVVMPTFNGAKYIKEAVQSILEQTHQNFELIIIDDGSTDNTKEIIESFNDKRIKYTYQNNKGPAAAYNAGFKRAASEFIFIMDHDDYSYPNRIERQLEYMQDNGLNICGSWYEIEHVRNRYIENVKRNYPPEKLNEVLMFLPWAIATPTICLRKEVFIQYGYFNEKFKAAFDYEFVSRLIFNERIGIVPSILFRWRNHKKSYSSLTARDGRAVFKKIAETKIRLHSSNIPQENYFMYLGLLNYYSDDLIKSLKYLLTSLFLQYDKNIFKYILTIIFGGIAIKIIRKYELFSLPVIRSVKKALISF